MQTPRKPTPLLLALVMCACSAGIEPPPLVVDQSRRSDLGVFMKTRMNPPFSKLSFLLFHAESEDDGGDASLAATGDELASAATALAAWTRPPGESEQGKLVFYDYAESLKADASTLQSAVRANQKQVAVKTFELLRKRCDSCHHFFRFDQTGSLHALGAGGQR